MFILAYTDKPRLPLCICLHVRNMLRILRVLTEWLLFVNDFVKVTRSNRHLILRTVCRIALFFLYVCLVQCDFKTKGRHGGGRGGGTGINYCKIQHYNNMSCGPSRLFLTAMYSTLPSVQRMDTGHHGLLMQQSCLPSGTVDVSAY